ncbi:MAG: hypothetical protein H7146_07640 [Burkholderiaceae bacterium]|nr:hypothetical protein [Microbacteriaceae bacterium]
MLITICGALLVVVCIGSIVTLGSAAFVVRRVAVTFGSDATFLVMFAVCGAMIAWDGTSMWGGPRGNGVSVRPRPDVSRRPR